MPEVYLTSFTYEDYLSKNLIFLDYIKSQLLYDMLFDKMISEIEEILM